MSSRSFESLNRRHTSAPGRSSPAARSGPRCRSSAWRACGGTCRADRSGTRPRPVPRRISRAGGFLACRRWPVTRALGKLRSACRRYRPRMERGRARAAAARLFSPISCQERVASRRQEGEKPAHAASWAAIATPRRCRRAGAGSIRLPDRDCGRRSESWHSSRFMPTF